jgi:hypothetical protein
MAWPAPWRENGSTATVIVFGEPACVHYRILLMLHDAGVTFSQHNFLEEELGQGRERE